MKTPSSPWWLLAAVLVGCGTSDASFDTSDPLPKRSDISNGPDGGVSSTPASTGLPCDVQSVLAERCQTCHGSEPSFGAPNALVTYADLTKTLGGKKVTELVAARVHDAARPMPPQPNPRLDTNDLAILDAWIAKGAPSSNETCGGGAGGAPVTKPLSCTPDTLVRPASKWTMPANKTDEYVCYGFDVNPGSKRHVIALAPKVDNKTIVHHIILFQSPDAVSATPAPCSQGGGVTWRMVAGWAPGGGNVELPPEAGFPESGTTHWVAQVHYNNAQSLAGQVDGSGYDLCTTDKLRANDADIMAFGATKFTIPPRGKLDMTCDFNVPAQLPEVHVFAGAPHMHKLGKSLSTHRIRGGVSEAVVDQPNFDFQTQVGYSTNLGIKGGDTVRTRCVWQNPGDQSVGFGENTADEMCFMFVSYYPKIDSSLFNWALPAAAASCH